MVVIGQGLWYNNIIKTIRRIPQYKMNKAEFTYLSSDKVTSIHALRWEPAQEVIGVVQIAHGMVEYADRYDLFAQFLTEKGFVVTANDHLGHGASVTGQEQWGYFAEKDGAGCVFQDMHKLTRLTKEAYPNIPYFLFGHSMGSFLSRRYLCLYGKELAGAVICGTGYQSPVMLAAGKMITKIIAAIKGWKHRSRFVDALAFGGFNRAYEPSETHKEWLSRDPETIQANLADPRCNFMFTLNGYYALFENIALSQNKSQLINMPKALPVLFIAGDDDPVGHRGKDITKVVDRFKKAGMEKVDVILYKDFRHEILNEIGKEQVYEDVASWLADRMVGKFS